MKTGQMLKESSAPLEMGVTPFTHQIWSPHRENSWLSPHAWPPCSSGPARGSRVHAGAAAGRGPRPEQTHRPARVPACAAPRQRPRRRPPARPRPSGAVETDLAVRAPAPARRGGLGTRAHRARPRRCQDVRAQGRGLGVAISGRAPGHVGARPNGNAPVHTVAHARARA